MKQKYHPYWLWEDYKNGMYKKQTIEFETKNKKRLLKFMSNYKLWGESMQNVIYQWPISTEHNLTDLSQNRKAWLGQAACCLKLKCPEYMVREIWNLLTDKQKDNANKIANNIINNYVDQINNKYEQGILKF